MTEMLIRRPTDSMTEFINVDANLGRHPVRRLTDQGLFLNLSLAGTKAKQSVKQNYTTPNSTPLLKQQIAPSLRDGGTKAKQSVKTELQTPQFNTTIKNNRLLRHSSSQ